MEFGMILSKQLARNLHESPTAGHASSGLKQRTFRLLLICLAAFLGTWGCYNGEDSGYPENRIPGCEGNASFDPGYSLLSSGFPVQDKNDYLLTLHDVILFLQGRHNHDRQEDKKSQGG